jgi:hypothetical protein
VIDRLAHRLVATAVTAVASIIVPSIAQAAVTTFVVDSTAEESPPAANGNCTLGEALRAAGLDAPVDQCTSPAIGSGGPFIIELSNAVYTLSTVVSLSTSLPAVSTNVTVNGHGATIERSSDGGTPQFRLFFVHPSGSLALNDLTLAGGFVRGADGGSGSGANGGAILSSGTLTLTRVTLRDNEAGGGTGSVAVGDFPAGDGGNGFGGALYNDGGTATLVNCTASSNTARGGTGGPGSSTLGGTPGNGGNGFGGAVFNRNGTLTLRNCTLAGNTVVAGSAGSLPSGSMNPPGQAGASAGGALYNFGENAPAAAVLYNSILADTASGTDCENVSAGTGSVTMNGGSSLLESKGTCTFSTGSFLEVDPELEPLALNAPGLTATHALPVTSPAADTADAGPADGMAPHCESTDQRGVARPQDADGIDGARCDIGAYEIATAGEGCPEEVDPGCLTGFTKAMLLVKDDVAGKEKLIAKLGGGPATVQTDMGNPLAAELGGTGTAFTLCIYDGNGDVAGTVLVDRAGETCGTAPCWTSIGKAPNDPAGPGKGYKYGDKAVAADGVLKLLFKSGDAGKTGAMTIGKGDGLPDGIPAALQMSAQATMQLRSSDGVCLSATVTEITKQEAGYFKAK